MYSRDLSMVVVFTLCVYVVVLTVSVDIRLVVLYTFMNMIFAVCIHVICLRRSVSSRLPRLGNLW